MGSFRLQRLYPLIALSLLAGATIWLERTTRIGDEKAVSGLRHDPDLFVETFTLHRFNINGAEEYELTGSHMVHFPDDDSSIITSPNLDFTGEGRPLVVRAKQATVFQGGDRVFLEGDVQADRAGDGQHPPMSFRSATLTVWPNEERGETRTPLVLTQGASVIHAQGMEAQNLIGELTLTGNVRAKLLRNKAANP